MASPRNGGLFGADSGDAGSVGSSRVSRPMLTRVSSFSVMKDSVMWLGEQAQTQFLDRNLEAHANNNNYSSYQNYNSRGSEPDDASSGNAGLPMKPVSSIPRMISMNLNKYSSFDNITVAAADQKQVQTIRFQVIVWSVGCPDVKNDLVSMKFRVTLFWNDISSINKDDTAKNNGKVEQHAKSGMKKNNNSSSSHQSIWIMAGRGAAYKKRITEISSDTIAIPPVSILNAESFDVIGQVSLIILPSLQ